MFRYVKIALLVLLCFTAEQGVARIISVSTASAINKTWSAGDTLVMPNGTYSNLSLTIQGTGTAAEPIVLCAAKPGMVFLEGSSNVTLKGKYIEVNGLRFSIMVYCLRFRVMVNGLFISYPVMLVCRCCRLGRCLGGRCLSG